MPIALVLLASAAGRYPLSARHLLFLAPSLFLLCVLGMEQVASLFPRRLTTAAWMLGAAGFVLPMAARLAMEMSSPIRRQHVRPLVERLARERQPGELVYVSAVAIPAWTYYTTDWRPTRMLLEGTTRGQEVAIKTTFADGQASSAITVAGKTDSKADAVAADTVVLPNAFLGSYAALAQRLTVTGAKAGAAFRAYIAPQGEVPLRLDGVFAEQIQTPRETIAATRYALLMSNPAAGGEMQVSVWATAGGDLLRMSVPAQMLEIAREDIASAAARTTAFSIAGEENVNIPASGFNLAASVAKPGTATGPLPAIVIVNASTKALIGTGT